MKYLNLAGALFASLKPKPQSQQPGIDSYGQSTLSPPEEQAFMEWLFGSLMGAGYFGKAHLIWDNGKNRERDIFRFFLTCYAKLTIKMPRTANIYFCSFQSS